MKGSRKLRILVAGAMLGLLALVVAVGASAAKSKPGVDRSYGVEGVASVLPANHPAGYPTGTRFAEAPDGSAYMLNTQSECVRDTCTSTGFIYRVAPSGAFDASFGGGGWVRLPAVPRGAGEPSVSMTVDSSGRVLVGRVESGAVVVRRFTAAGAPDGSFGAGGTISLPCSECERTSVWLLSAPNGRVVVERQRTLPPQAGSGSTLGGSVSLTRLTKGGWPERHFGDGGTVAVGLGQRYYPGEAAVSPRGAILFGAIECCGANPSYLVRVSNKGRVDTKFGKVAGRSLAKLSFKGDTSTLKALLPRANGTIELLGVDASGDGFDLRLKANGEPGNLGHGGLRTLPFSIEAARLGSEGGIFVVGSVGIGPYSAFRLFADGRVDPAFGPKGIQLPLSGSGYRLGNSSRGKVLVFDAGNYECRGDCPPTPGIARFREGSGKG